jgi:hypothetical protein
MQNEELEALLDAQRGINEGLLRVVQALALASIHQASIEEAIVLHDLLGSISEDEDCVQFLGPDGVESFKDVLADTMRITKEGIDRKRGLLD